MAEREPAMELFLEVLPAYIFAAAIMAFASVSVVRG